MYQSSVFTGTCSSALFTMCPFAHLWQQGQYGHSEAANNPNVTLESNAQHTKQQQLAADAASWHDAARRPIAATVWPSQLTSCPFKQQHALPHSTSCNSLVDEVTTFSIPALGGSSNGSSSGSPKSQTSSSAQDGTSTTGSSSSSNLSTHQHWQLRRPQLDHDPKLTRRQLRRLGRSWTLADVVQHKYCDDGWIAVDGKVYDITEHLVNHPGWDSGCQVTTVLSIIAHLGTDCSEEFREIHRPYPVAWKQLQAYYIGDLAE